MAEEWFWKHKGQMLGPLGTETLADLVQKRRVFDRDEVRFAESQQWISGAELKQLFTGTAGASTADAAAALLAHVRRPDNSDEAATAELHVPRVRTPGVLSWAGGVASSAVGWLFVAVAGPLLAVSSRFGKLIIAVAVFATAGALFVTRLDLSRGQNEQVVANLESAAERMHELRNKSTSDAEWAEFAVQTREWLKPTISELQARSKRFPLQGNQWFDFERVNARTRHDLIRAGNALDKELDQGPLNLGDPVAFHSLLQEAVNKLEGQEFRGWNRPRGPAGGTTDVDLLTIGFLTFDGLLLMGGTAWWLRRKRARAS